MSTKRKAFLWTAIPIVVLSVVSMTGGFGDCSSYLPHSFYWAWFVAASVGAIGILFAIGLSITHKKRMASGIIIGVGVGILALAPTCSVNIASRFFWTWC